MSLVPVVLGSLSPIVVPDRPGSRDGPFVTGGVSGPGSAVHGFGGSNGFMWMPGRTFPACIEVAASASGSRECSGVARSWCGLAPWFWYSLSPWTMVTTSTGIDSDG